MSAPKAFVFVVFCLLGLSSVHAQRASAKPGHTRAWSTVFAKAANYVNFQGKDLEALRIDRRSREDIFKNGGSDFRITAKGRFYRRFLKRGAFLVQSGDSLYINCYVQGAGPGYSYAQRLGDELIFAAPRIELRHARKPTKVSVGGRELAVNAPLHGLAALRRYHYAYNLTTGRVDRLTRARMIELLAGFPALAERYESERQPGTPYTVKRYAHAYQRLVDAGHALTDEASRTRRALEGAGGR